MSPANPAPFVFFTSYARNRNEKQVARFHEDVSNWVRSEMGRGVGEPGFLDQRNIPPGHDWEYTLLHNTATAGCMVALVSESYLTSGWCGREWGVFNDRIHRSAPHGPPGIPAIIPVRWEQIHSTLPSVISRSQFFSPATPGSDLSRRPIIELQALYPEVYAALCLDLAKQIAVAARLALPPIDWREAAAVPPAFGDPATATPPAPTGPSRPATPATTARTSTGGGSTVSNEDLNQELVRLLAGLTQLSESDFFETWKQAVQRRKERHISPGLIGLPDSRYPGARLWGLVDYFDRTRNEHFFRGSINDLGDLIGHEPAMAAILAQTEKIINSWE
ncbi:hypothetical protein DPM19_13600 [Actinomadura craniellae]|uniref:TIR domain-containing protein n=1 Tax=Actinomadura craniellae TaxID=2231787 RepID=A0A365H6V3_9ACTN|nr:toll/interleukin-1 receptor domain-containing protein [Actinomadura craniellae]RAY14769.1 hypothetical protein DPM19_13600 [Actinomadura craniellae]